MLASEHCTDSLYDSQYHSVKMANNYNFKQESELILDNESSTTIANTTLTTSPSPQPSPGVISNQQAQHNLSQPSWYQQQQQQHSTSGASTNYSTQEMYYASLPPPPPAPPVFAFPSPLPKKKQLASRNHPRHHSANGILQQYAHYHYQQPQQPQQPSIPTHTLQRQPSSSSSNGTSSLPAVYTVPSSSTTNCTATNPYYSSTTSQSSSSPTESTLSSLSPTSALKQPQQDRALETSSPLPVSITTPLRYQISLQAATAAAQRFGEHHSLTYLNRGQAYGLHFNDQHYNSQTTPKNTIVTSTISITFHDATHRQASQNYWRFWLSQQDRPNEARALDLDTQQSSGLVNVLYPSFDRITIQWEPHVGATLFVRFNCLSTDFSRIKGVKGIPLRAFIESTADVAPNSSSTTSSTTDGYEKYTEKAFCKIKLFRDKGAERKNKDDAKQIAKQLEKLKAEKNPQHNPLWHFYNRPQLPYSIFEPLPEEDDLIKADFPLVSSASLTTPIPPLPIPTVASNTATSLPPYGLPPPSYSSTSSPPGLSPSSSILSNTIISPSQPLTHGRNGYQLHQQQQQHDNNMTIMSSFYPPTFSYPSHFVQPTHSTSPFVYHPMTSPSLPPSSLGYQQQPSWSVTSNTSPVLGMKRSRSHVMTPSLDQPSPPEDQPSTKKHRGTTPALTLFVDTKKNSSPSTSSSSSSSSTATPPMELKEIKLETLTVHQLIAKLSEVFSLQAQSVTEVLWRRDSTGTISSSSPSSSSDHQHALEQQQKKLGSTNSPMSNILVLVEDNVLENFPDQTVMSVQWEISSSGMVRFILDF